MEQTDTQKFPMVGLSALLQNRDVLNKVSHNEKLVCKLALGIRGKLVRLM